MTWYCRIVPLGEPFDIGELDPAGRIQIALNFDVLKRPSSEFLPELVAVLVAAGVGVAGVSIFGSSLAQLPPAGDGPFLSVRATGGRGPLGTHNDGVAAYRRPTAQVIVRARTQQAAETMAQAAYSALVAVQNQAVSA